MPSSVECRPAFPFTAVVGQSLLKRALLLATIDPKLGGVLISGPRGIAKSTLARGLAALLPEKQSRLITLPLSADESQLVGTLDLEHALHAHEATFRPGLLAKAHRGILYIDEVNLLADHLVDALLDVASSGVNHVERDGISHQHPAEFVLIGTMNPDEGELRPQLSDRFGLSVTLDEQPSIEERMAIVRARRDYESDPLAFEQRYSETTCALRARIIQAQAILAAVELSEPLEWEIAQRCLDAGVEGVRADLAWQRAAIAHAALHERTQATEDDVEAVAPLVLAHRASSTSTPPSTPPQGGQSSAPSGSPLGGGSAASNTSTNTSGDDGSHAAPYRSIRITQSPTLPARSASPQRSPRTLDPVAVRVSRPTRQHRRSSVIKGGHGTRTQQTGHLSASSRIHWPATLTHADNRRGVTRWVYHDAIPQCLELDIILLDTSASTRTRHAFSHALALAEQLATQTRRARGRIALQRFSGNEIEWLASGTRLRHTTLEALRQIVPHGGTPLANALLDARQQITQFQRQMPYAAMHTWLLTDARTRDEITASPWPTPLTVIDTEQGRIKLHRARTLAERLGGDYTTLDDYWQPITARTRPTLSTLGRMS